ncbi:hypothetical protein EYC80_007909 [Monilinia laxa]|uniref:BTB domain-containing protein n=1 Tax=Monilinia laxa TaxID=61186 RepID=A0A5N6JUP1_MONLA|nr:hypothetical protein EYC80_007909 [Monilinia laxa]
MSPGRSSDNDSVETTRALWARMMNANEYSDFIIKCHSKTFHVHRVVVCTQSKPIKAAANGNFRESITGILDLEDDDPNTVARMINFLYTQDYDDTTTSEESQIEPHGPLLVNTMLYILADKYDIPPLKTLATKKFERALRTDWNSPSFTASLNLLYEQLPESDTCLTSRALRAACLHARDLKDREDFTALCRSNPDIAYDLFATMASEPVALTSMKLPEPFQSHKPVVYHHFKALKTATTSHSKLNPISKSACFRTDASSGLSIWETTNAIHLHIVAIGRIIDFRTYAMILATIASALCPSIAT